MSRVLDYVRGDRLWDRLQSLAAHGAIAQGGVNRQALSAEEVGARRQLVDWGREIGLQAYTDPLANLFLRLEGSNPTLPPVLSDPISIANRPADAMTGSMAYWLALRRSMRSVMPVSCLNALLKLLLG